MKIRKLTLSSTVLLALAVPLAAQAVDSPWGALSVSQDIDRGSLTEYSHKGKTYVAGEQGQPYSLNLRNPSGSPVLAVVSIDGVNVLDGKAASYSGPGYIIPAYGLIEVKGWRKSLSEVARFNFAGKQDSYATRTGRATNVGVIGAAIFLMKPPAPSFSMSKIAPEAPMALNSRQADSTGAQELGTGHGPRETSTVTTVDFERASSRPATVLALYYDTHQALLAKGVILEPIGGPLAFPIEPQRRNHFVPDPR
jgi:hypothetical protein